MEMQSSLLSWSNAFVSALLTPLSAIYQFHNLEHTKEVVRAARVIGRASRLTPDQLDSVMIAAWFHDIGYVEGVDGHEERSASIAAKVLTAWGATDKKVADVSRPILATRIPRNPKDILGMVLCDANLSHLASARYEMHISNLRKEQETALGISAWNERDWYQRTVDFLGAHQYFTDYGKNILDRRKKVNLNKTIQQLHVT